MLVKILTKYPELSADWLLTGRGEMLKTNSTLTDTPPDEQPHVSDKDTKKVWIAQENEQGIPLIPFSAMAGALRGELAALEYECEHYIVPAFSDADFLMPVKGNSMTPTYLSGDIVACRKVPMTGIFFQWNKPYVLDTTQGAIIKRVKPGSDKQHVLIVSDNKDYDPYELPYEDIYAVALVIGIIRLE
ncbi:MAG: helix-turn-helix transcriptional regulator [Bacteroidaceae bacterium]|nr:helix-turn-helix transcriptional regulator [Bacteroidaceae bacterium]